MWLCRKLVVVPKAETPGLETYRSFGMTAVCGVAQFVGHRSLGRIHQRFGCSCRFSNRAILRSIYVRGSARPPGALYALLLFACVEVQLFFVHVSSCALIQNRKDGAFLATVWLPLDGHSCEIHVCFLLAAALTAKAWALNGELSALGFLCVVRPPVSVLPSTASPSEDSSCIARVSASVTAVVASIPYISQASSRDIPSGVAPGWHSVHEDLCISSARN